MKKSYNLILVLVSAVAITFLFHRRALGINLLLFESVIFGWFIITKQLVLKTRLQFVVAAALVVSAVATLVTHSLFSYIMHFTTLFLLVGMMSYPGVRSLVHAAALSFINIAASQGRFLGELGNSKFKGRRVGSRLRRLRIFLIPLAIIILFVILYRNSNPVFDKMVIDAGTFLSEKLNIIFMDFDFLILLTFLVGLLISNQMIMRVTGERIMRIDATSSDYIMRSRRIHRRRFRVNALLNEYRAGLFLLAVLNIFLLILNIMDIKHVWFVFEWEGQYLKEFVHRGTYMLILSILISIVIVLYYFRGNINFYRNNRLLKLLSYIWLVQNAILVVSVAIRNTWYIKYFALAYKRIGVYIFLLLALFGLITVLLKVWKGKSAFYLLRVNTLAIFLVLILGSVPDWDSMIARYNFAHADRAFLHLDYMSTLTDKALPFLDVPLEELQELNRLQTEKFPFEYEYMTPVEYYLAIMDRRKDFVEAFESRGILEMNLAEHRAYKALVVD
ncbi:MAG: DUF4173 domain-containing protein [Bacteroidetes bacterium]|nr:DUF4173 domain-containing protein [Bacteroidota bacterium]